MFREAYKSAGRPTGADEDHREVPQDVPVAAELSRHYCALAYLWLASVAFRELERTAPPQVLLVRGNISRYYGRCAVRGQALGRAPIVLRDTVGARPKCHWWLRNAATRLIRDLQQRCNSIPTASQQHPNSIPTASQ